VLTIYFQTIPTASTAANPENNNLKNRKSVERKVTISVRQFYERSEHNDVTEMIKNRMKSLHMDEASYCM
jgi:hypothetical protein